MASTIKSLRKTHAREGKGAEHWELSSVGTRWTKSTLRACLGLLVEHRYLGKDRYPGSRDGSSQDHSPRTRNSREDFPHSQQLQGRQMGKHPVLDFWEGSIYQAPIGKRGTIWRLCCFQKVPGRMGEWPCPNSSTQEWGFKQDFLG